MWMEAIEIFMEKICPERWEAYQQARYDYEGYISREEADEHPVWGSEFWCACPGKRRKPVEVVCVEGRRYRVTDGPCLPVKRGSTATRSGGVEARQTNDISGNLTARPTTGTPL